MVGTHLGYATWRFHRDTFKVLGVKIQTIYCETLVIWVMCVRVNFMLYVMWLIYYMVVLIPTTCFMLNVYMYSGYLNCAEIAKCNY